MISSSSAHSLPEAEPNPLIVLFRQCVVRIDDEAGRFRGTGFFVAPGQVLTCAHVVHGAGELRLHWAQDPISATVTDANPPLESVADPQTYPLPDLALLRTDGTPPPDHPCVSLAAQPPALGTSPDALYLAGYTIEHGSSPALTGATTEFESRITENGFEFYKLKRGLLLPGFSGSPLLNMRTGLVAGIVESSRGRYADFGGFAVSITELAARFADVFESNQRFHRTDFRWPCAMEAERTLAAVREGKRARLPLRVPVVTLRPGDEASPATLLRPRHAVVGYVGRERLLGDLTDWRETARADEHTELWFVTGAGGYGKTRLAVEACVQAEAAHWTAGLLRPKVSDARVRELAEWPGRLLIAIDYAETRPAVVGRFVEELAARAPRPRVRIMLLVRRRASRDELLATFNDQQDEELAAVLRRAPISRLEDTSAEVDRDRLFERAITDFDSMLGASSSPPDRPQLQAAHFTRPLYVLVAALLARMSPATNVAALSESDLLLKLIAEHESHYWERWDDRRKLGLDPEDRRIAVAVATLLTAVNDAEALTIARLIPHHSEEPERRLLAIARWLAQLYPYTADDGQIGIGPLEPDRLGEVLVGDVLRHHRHLLATAIDEASDRQLAQALNVTGRIAQGDPVIRDQLRTVLDGKRLGNLIQRSLNADE